MATKTEMASATKRLEEMLRIVPGFPKPGIDFVDITPVLRSGQFFRFTINCILERYAKKRLDAIVGVDARGFIFGAAVACQLGIGFVPVRKKGKLPYKTIEAEYDLEYGSNTLAIHEDALEKGQRVALVDDLLATGGTAAAAGDLIRRLGAEVVEMTFVVELEALHGREKLESYPVHSLVTI